MTPTPKNPKLPLSKSSRLAFEKRFQEVFLKEADKGIEDEVLMKAVNDYEEANPNSAPGTQQKTIQVEADKGIEDEVELDEEGNPKEINDSSLSEEEVAEIKNKYFDLFGRQPLESLIIDQAQNEINLKNNELAELEKVQPNKVESNDIDLKEGEVLAKHISSGEERVFQRNTLKYLLDWKEYSAPPKEIKNLK